MGEREEVEDVRLLTTKPLVCSARTMELRQQRNRRRGPDDDLQSNLDSRRTEASREARLGEDIEDNGAHLFLEAICPGRCGTAAT